MTESRTRDSALRAYQRIERRFFESLRKKLSKNLLLYCVTGSLARREVYAGWSDIDILLIIRKYDHSFFRKLNEALSDNDSGIKIGTTIYSAREYARTDIFFDPKSQYSLELIRSGVYKPRHINALTVDQLRPHPGVIPWFDAVNLTRLLHELKRNLIGFERTKERAVYKSIITILKILALQKGTTSASYDDTITNAREILGYSHYLPTVEDVAYEKSPISQRHMAYIAFISWLENTLYKR